jgi:hypothetical protein
MDWFTKHAAGVDPATLLASLRGEMAAAAQEVYDSWEQDEDGVDPMLGGGGICDEIAREIGNILAGHGFDLYDGGGEGEDHAWNIATMDGKAYAVDIPCRTYETGAGYSWTKKPGVVMSAQDVAIWEIPYEDVAERFDRA